jgi:hypothetical protein
MNKKFQYRFLAASSENIYKIAFITSIIVMAGLLLFRLLLLFSYNGEIGGIDNNFVYAVVRNLKGYDLYPDPAHFPYAINLYSPLYYTICTAIGRIIHINADEPIYVYQLCRSVSLACDMMTCAVLYLVLTKRFNIIKELSGLTVACFASILCFLGYTFSRCDSLLLLFYAAFMYVLTSRSLLKKTSLVFLAALLSVGCILSKQNGIIVPVLALTWLLLQGAKKMAAYYFIFFTGLMVTALLIYFYIFKYHFLFDNTITALQNRIDLSWFYSDIFKRSMNSLWALPLYFAGVMAVKLWIRPASAEDKSLAAIFIIQTIFSLGSSLKWGSTAGYFNESFLLAFILITGKMAKSATERYPSFTKKMIAVFLPLFVFFFIHTVAQGYLFFIQKREEKKEQYMQQEEIRDYLLPKLQGHYVFNMGNQNTDFYKTLFYREMAVPDFDMVDCCTLPDHTFDYSSLKQDLSNGRIACLLAPEKMIFTDIWGVSLRNFHKDTTIHGCTIYYFRQP